MKILNYQLHRFFVLCLCFFPLLANSQTTLHEKLRGKTTLREIMSAIDDYYKGKPANWTGEDGSLPRLKIWKRWEWYMANRLGPRGEVVDINEKNMKAYEQIHSSSRTINNFWTFIGPGSIDGFGLGRADRIAFHPTDPNTYYVGSSGGGLWKTTNDGTSWTPLTDFIASLGVSGVVVSWADGNVIYILTGDGDSDLLGGLVDQFDYERKSMGVFRSTDAGATWVKMGQLDTVSYLPFNMAMSPTDANTLLVAASTGLYRTTNGGSTWSKELSGQFHDVEFKPGTNRAYAASLNAVSYSTDGGDNWFLSVLDSTITSPRRLELAVTPANTNIVYLLVGNSGSPVGQFGGFYKSTNSGVTYAEISNSPNILGRDNSAGQDNYQQARYSHAMAVSSSNANKIVTGAVYNWRSGNGGISWVPSNGPHPDQHMLAYNPLNGFLYSCDDGGIYKSTNDGLNWTALVTDFEASQVYHLKGTKANANCLLAGLQDNGAIHRTTNTSDFDELLYLDGFMLAYAPNCVDTLYAGGNNEVKRTRDGGVTFDSITPLGPNDKEFFGNVLTHISNKNTIFMGFSSVFKSTNQGDNWTNTGAWGNWAMANCPSNANRIYCAGDSSYTPGATGQFWRSDNLGTTWAVLQTNPGFPPMTSGTKITGIGVNPTNANRVYVSFGGFIDGVKVYRSFFAGAGWEDWSGSLPNVPVNAIVVDASENVYIGTDVGVFYRSQTMDDWMPYRNNLPNAPVTDFVLDEANNKIQCSTFGRGIWSNTLVESCPLTLTFISNLTGYKYYQADDHITSTSLIIGSENSDVHFRAGNYVLLTPPFRAQRNASFSARIGECGSGGIPLTNENKKD